MKKTHITQALKAREKEKRAMAKKGEQMTYKAGNEIEYMFQHTGLREAYRLRDRAGNSTEALYNEFITHIIFVVDADGVPNKATWEHFDEHGCLNEVMQEASQYLFQKAKNA